MCGDATTFLLLTKQSSYSIESKPILTLRKKGVYPYQLEGNTVFSLAIIMLLFGASKGMKPSLPIIT